MNKPITYTSKLNFDPFDFVESCEPDCTPERHAYHEGQWDMATRINAHFELPGYPGALASSTTDELKNHANGTFPKNIADYTPVPPTNDSELDEILLQFIAEYHQGLNELAGHGTATEQARGALLAWRQEAIDGALADAATPTAHNEQVDELVRDIMKVPYSKHKAKARLLQWRQEAIDELREYDNLLTVRAIDGAQENCNAVPDDQPNDVHIRFFNQGYKKGVDTSLRELLEKMNIHNPLANTVDPNNHAWLVKDVETILLAAIKKNGGEL